ncbi:MAG: D-hexose-6-phosphate mutarotase [Halopseudomonas sp.]|uniref:D-hexose-6-phosphate mutarotase n=1 Tax=Halopseudomonas sp. TaxID=2901191 RepID=UPI003001E3AF
MSTVLPDCMRHTSNPAGKAFIDIQHPAVEARIALEGAHLLQCVPAGQRPLLWVSPDDPQLPGKALRGGIPLCWPWFGGDRPTGAHGIARRLLWQLTAATEDEQGVYLRFDLPPERIAEALPDEPWQVHVEYRLNSAIDVRLTTTNAGQQPMRLTQALHTYLPVSDIHRVRISGLDQAAYIDAVDGWKQKSQTGDIDFTGELDRIYHGHAASVRLHDSRYPVVVERRGSESVVVWNPWQAKSLRLSEFPAEGYLGMLCIEAANAGPDARQIQPGQSHTLGTRLSRPD